jgi:hypothetical protein
VRPLPVLTLHGAGGGLLTITLNTKNPNMNVFFDPEQQTQLRQLLDLSPTELPTADHILRALRDALKTRRAADKSLSLSHGHGHHHHNPLLADARRRAVAALLGT